MCRPQRTRQRSVDREAESRQGERHDGKQAAGLAPALADLHGGIECRDGYALPLALDEQRLRNRFAGMENGTIDRCVAFGCGNLLGERAAADTLPKGADLVL